MRDDEPLTFTCPRCGTDVAERLYGPCTSCRAQLRADLGGEASDVERTRTNPR
ncbi:MAG: hypothetical protein R2690_10785 [Acidimicrobiales bacterium]